MKRTVILLAAAVFLAAPALSQEKTLTKTEKDAVISSLIRNINDQYVFPDVAKSAGKQLLAQQKKGVYSSYSEPKDFAKALTMQMRDIVKDKHLGIRYDEKRASTAAAAQPDSVAQAQWEAAFIRFMKKRNLGFPKADILPGNVGYLKVDGFGPVDKVAETCSGAMAFLANTDAMIIDMRDNHGGEPAMVQYLISYFLMTPPCI